MPRVFLTVATQIGSQFMKLVGSKEKGEKSKYASRGLGFKTSDAL
jgi:hypothetical protein